MIKTTEADVAEFLRSATKQQTEIAESISEKGLAIAKSENDPDEPIWILTRLEPNKMSAMGNYLMLEIGGLEEALKDGKTQKRGV